MTDVGMEYRWIDGRDASDAEWDRIEMILVSRGWMALARQTTRVLVAERGNKLLAFFVLQLIPHTEPLWIAPSERGRGIAEELVERMLDFLAEVGARGFMAVANSPVAARICQAHHMQQVTDPVFVMLPKGGD